MNTLARLVADIELSLNNDLHLMVRVRVHQGRPLLETIEATGHGLLGVGARIHVAEEGVLVGDLGGLEARLRFGIVGEGELVGHLLGGGGWFGVGSGFGFAEEVAHGVSGWLLESLG
jgi:hypothetical protein